MNAKNSKGAGMQGDEARWGKMQWMALMHNKSEMETA